ERQRLVLGDASVVFAFGSLFRATKRVAAAWCWRYSVQNEVSGCSFVSRNREKRVLCFVDKIEIWLLGLEKKRKQPAMKSDAKEQQWQRGDGLQWLEEQQRQQSSGQRSSSGRSASLAVRYDIAGPIAAKQRKERKQSNGYSVSIYYVSAGSSSTLEHSRALRLQGRSVSEAGDWGGGRDLATPAKERMSRLRQQYQRSLGGRC
ncbi:hypothetical protein BHM03_00022410, partial [Ensete ventricosum]